MRILKIGQRIGAKGTFAVVQVGGLIKLAMQNPTGWTVIAQTEFTIVSKAYFLNQLF